MHPSMEVVRGLVLDAALLFVGEEENGRSPQLVPDASQTLLRLRYSNLRLGFLFWEDSKESVSKKEIVLESIGVLDATGVIAVGRHLSVKEALQKFGTLWGIPSTSCVYITEQQTESIEGGPVHNGWTIIPFTTGNKTTGNGFGDVTTLNRLHEIPAVLANLNKWAQGPPLVVVGHTMKWSRELDFLKRGALPILPNQYGLSFVPIQLDQPFEKQLSGVDVILHKATDERLSIDSEQFGLPDSVKFSKGICELQRYLLDHPQVCVVDPLGRVLPLLDRGTTQAILQNLQVPVQQIIRSPRSVEVTSFEEPYLSKALELGNVLLPAIVKPRIACGASEAHTMAVIFKKEGFRGLPVPLPACIQEYIDHGACQYKIYVLGNNVLHSCRKSTPNGAVLAGANNDAPSIVFDSLKSLPVVADSGTPGEGNPSSGAIYELNMEAVQAAADCLGKTLGLTIFGFDLVVQAETNDYVIVDVNYFPSFKDVPDTKAIPAFWDALITAHHQWNRSGHFGSPM